MSVTENELKVAATGARVSMEDVLESIQTSHYFTARDGVLGELASDGVPATPYELSQVPESLGLMTFCVITMKNGFTVVGQSACADKANYNKNIGDSLAKADAVKKIWPLLGYELRSKLYQKDNSDWLSRAKLEEQELSDKRTKLNAFVGSKAFYALPEQDQHDLTVQLGGMKMYHEALQTRLRRTESV